MPPAARVTDLHTCPMAPPPGLPILPPCALNVLIGFLPAARMSDLCACIGPPPAPVDAIVFGSPTVLIGGLPAARMGDPTAKGGVITTGFPTVLIGVVGSAAPPAPGAPAVPVVPRVKGMEADAADALITESLQDAIDALNKRIEDLDNWDDATAESFRKWFGTDDDAARATIRARMEASRDLLQGYTLDNFQPDDDAYAYVYPNDDQTIYLGEPFADAPATGRDSRAGTLIHEVSHFDSVEGTDDHAYGEHDCAALALLGADALDNADNFEYFVEDGM